MSVEDSAITFVANPAQSYLSNLDISVFIINFYSCCSKKRQKTISKLFDIIESGRLDKELLKSSLDEIFLRYGNHERIYGESLEELRKINDIIIENIMRSEK